MDSLAEIYLNRAGDEFLLSNKLLFANGPKPNPPFPVDGLDPTEDELGC